MKNFFFFIFLASVASAGTISGKVTNGTSGKPAAGDDVILIKLAAGMEQEAQTKAAADGRYSLPVTDDSVPHLIRVVHDQVLYHEAAPPGTSHVDVTVYDAGAKIAGLTGNVDVLKMQTDSTGLQVTEMYVLRNNSSPPRTQMSDRSFEIYLPPAAALDSGVAAGPGGMPVRSAPAPLAEKGHYAFSFPIRPGETRFQVAYHLPYSGSANFSPRLTLPFDNLAVELPQSMQFSSAAGSFEKLVDEKGAAVQVARAVPAGNAPVFKVSGTGTIPEDALSDAGESNSAGPAASSNRADGFGASRPGGGLGNPESTPDPLLNYRWYILGGLIAVLAAAAFWITNRRPLPAAMAASAASGSAAPSVTTTAPRVSSNRGGLILEALKEELFQLESERLQDKISADEYEKAKAALDQTLARAIKRQQS